MGEGVLNRMDNFESFGGFQGMNCVITLGVFFHNLLLALVGRDCGIRIKG